MNKEERDTLRKQANRKDLVEQVLKSPGWVVVVDELLRLRKVALQAVRGDVENHARLAKWSGRLDVLEDLIAFPQKVIDQGTEALRQLNKGGNSDEE